MSRPRHLQGIVKKLSAAGLKWKPFLDYPGDYGMRAASSTGASGFQFPGSERAGAVLARRAQLLSASRVFGLSAPCLTRNSNEFYTLRLPEQQPRASALADLNGRYWPGSAETAA